MNWYQYKQNNSGGYYREPAINVVVEAPNAELADALAGVAGVDESASCCRCCGPRWSLGYAEEHATKPGMIALYGDAKPVAENLYEPAYDKATGERIYVKRDASKPIEPVAPDSKVTSKTYDDMHAEFYGLVRENEKLTRERDEARSAHAMADCAFNDAADRLVAVTADRDDLATCLNDAANRRSTLMLEVTALRSQLAAMREERDDLRAIVEACKALPDTWRPTVATIQSTGWTDGRMARSNCADALKAALNSKAGEP